MDVDASLPSLDPDAYSHALPLVGEEAWAVSARAVLRGGRPGVRADDPLTPTVVAIDTATADGRARFLFGDGDHPALAAHLRALVGPVTIHADTAITSRLPLWRPDATVRQCATFTFPASGAEGAFAMLPPGGIRRLRPADARHLTDFPAWLWASYGSAEGMLREGIVYARYLRAELVALACTSAATERYDAIAAYTIERTRRNGFARECAYRLVGAILNERGTLPVLTARAENEAAIGLAASLGMTERHDHTVYDLP